MTGAVVTDIEGTTSSIAFVKDVLFPYAADKLPGFIRSNYASDAVQEQLAGVSRESNVDATDTEGLIAQLLDWIVEDRKVTPLKTLQGMLWKQGYEARDYEAHVYDDAYRRMLHWKGIGIPLYVYSSGSIAAQKLFFQYSCFGDLRSLFSGYFDTTTGAKGDADSYRKIAAAISLSPDKLVFLSDVVSELDAARVAGFSTTWVARADTVAADAGGGESPHARVSSFSEITLTP